MVAAGEAAIYSSEQPSSMEANYRSWCFFHTAQCTATVTAHPKNTYRGLEQEVDYEQKPISPASHQDDVYVFDSIGTQRQLRTRHRLRLCCSGSNIRCPLRPPVPLVHTSIIQAPNLRAYRTFAFLC